MPESILSIIEEILVDDFKESETGGCYELKENKKKDYPITKVKKEGKLLVYSFDKDGFSLFPYFKGVKPINKCCDYVFFYLRNKILWVFTCELKSGSTQDATKKLYNSNIFISYVMKSLEAYCIVNNKIVNNNILSNIEMRSLILSTKKKHLTPLPTNPRKAKYPTNNKFKFKYLNLQTGTDIQLNTLCFM
jgi:hypothetical protein